MDVVIPLFAFLVLGVILTFGLTSREPAPERDRLRNILLGALILRLVLALLFALIPQIRFFHEDAGGYEWWGRQIARGWMGDAPDANYIREHNAGMPYLIAVFNVLLGQSLAIGSMMNAVVGAMTVLAVYRLARDFFHPMVAIRSAKLVAFFPSMILWSSLALKDPLVTLLAVLTLHAAMRLKRKVNLRDAVMLVACIAAIQPLRFYIVYFVAFAVSASFLIDRSRNLVRNLYLQVLIGALLFALVVALGWSSRLKAGSEMFSLERISEFRKGMASTAQSGFAENIDISTPLGALVFMPYGLAVLLLGPFPWQMLSFRAAMTLPEMIVWWAMVPPLILGLRHSIRNLLSQTSPILIFAATLSVAYSLIHGNVGSGFRQRTQIFVFLFIFASYGHYLRLCRKQRLDEKLLLAPASKQS